MAVILTFLCASHGTVSRRCSAGAVPCCRADS